MDKILSDEEKLRRAEAISERRSSRIPVNNLNGFNKRKKSRFEKYSIKIIVSICLFGICYFISQNNSELVAKIKPTMQKDLDFYSIYNYINKEKIDEDKKPTNEIKNDVAESTGIGGTEENIVEKEPEQEDEITKLKRKYQFSKPVNAKVTSKYGERTPTEIVSKNHGGIDLGCPTGTVITAAMDGKVEDVSDLGDYGNHFKIVNEDITTLYAHCSKIYVKSGDEVKNGQNIAEVGNTGRTTGPHLHFEIRQNNQTLDPEQLIKFE